MVIIVMGVSGSGKSTVGMLLAEKLGYSYHDADDFHPQENIDKMASGQPLNDEDRKPWLLRLNGMLKEASQTKNYAILACSALKQAYRDLLADGVDGCCVVYLKGDYDTIYERMASREDHYMGARMLESQFETLEEPTDALTVGIGDEPEAIVAQIEAQLNKV
ncbi:MAG: gluconokinase [Candidatus Latescibacteria bacterium]|jgi:gluconokinase|nr:gluconokinase [Candidatus Latescibacterota bacterium]MBT4138585.1 gluconokinase [Candidatus Latescibacterota bacterium]